MKVREYSAPFFRARFSILFLLTLDRFDEPLAREAAPRVAEYPLQPPFTAGSAHLYTFITFSPITFARAAGGNLCASSWTSSI